MAEHLAPIDESVKIPAAVQAAARAAEAFYQQQPQPNEPANADLQPDPEPVEPIAPAQVSADPQPANEPANDPPAPANDVNWEHRYRSMEGRVRQLTDVNNNLINQVQSLSSTVTQLQQPVEPFKPMITDEERKAYGDDLLSVVERKALEAVQPRMNQLAQENNQLKQRLQRDEANHIYSFLSAQLPNWAEINTHPDFIAWLNLPDVYSGHVKAGMLRAAFAAGDAGRVLAFFTGFLETHPEHRGQTPQPSPAANAPKRQAAVDLKSLAAPGKARPAGGNAPLPDEKPVYTTTQIDRFYDRVRRNGYAGREAEKNAEEARIFAAIREGRVRRGK